MYVGQHQGGQIIAAAIQHHCKGHSFPCQIGAVRWTPSRRREWKDAAHLSIGDILIEALYCRAHLKMHFYLEGGIKTVNMDACMLPFDMDMSVSLLSESEADQIWEVAFGSTNYVPLKDAAVLDPHVCPVFSRQWMEKHMLTLKKSLIPNACV